MSKIEYKSRVYTDRPPYADYAPPAKFQAIQSIIAKRLKEHPKAAYNIFGKSYEYRKKYVAYKELRRAEEKQRKAQQKQKGLNGQIRIIGVDLKAD